MSIISVYPNFTAMAFNNTFTYNQAKSRTSVFA
jgi:hypothetical protein